MKKVSVQLGSTSYEILIGADLLREAGKKLKELGCRDRVVVITDSVVKDLYGSSLEQSLAWNGFKVTMLTIPPGEEQKSLDTAAKLYTQLGDAYVERSTPILALGGGVIGDLSGFVAATYMRGVPLVQLPTTLLAQVDSSIGGKVAVDHGRLKNMIGAFYQPRLVLSDIAVLKSLNARQVSDGLAEIIKYAVIRDSGLFTYLENNIKRIRWLDEERLEDIVYKSVEIKARIVEQDERDLGLRHLLNFGHTVGHAIESVSNFAVGHGEAVALGMMAASRISHKLGMLDYSELSRIETLIEQAGLPVKLPGFNLEQMIQVMKHDKKMTQGKLKFVLAQSIGKAVVSSEVNLSLIEQVLINWNEKA